MTTTQKPSRDEIRAAATEAVRAERSRERLTQLLRDKGEILDAAEQLNEEIHAEGRDPTAEEDEAMQTAFDRVDAIDQKYLDTQKMLNRRRDQITPRQKSGAISEVRDASGRPVFMVHKGGRLADLPAPGGRREIERYAGITLGDMVVAAVTGRGSREVRAAMSEGSSSGGGYLVPMVIANDVIDKARSQSVLMQAGAITVPMTSESLRLCRIEGDPTISVKGENVAFSGTNATFGAIQLIAITMGCVIYASRELIEDAGNAASAITMAISGALAEMLDEDGLVGDGTSTSKIVGIANKSGINTTAVGGAITHAKMEEAVTLIQADDCQPNAYVLHPTIYSDYTTVSIGDGSNSPLGWLPPTPNVAELQAFRTTSVGTGTGIVGDFTKAVWGIRQEPLIEITNTGGDTFEKHQVGIKCTWRGDFGLLDEEAFCSLTGITT